jgi:tRNA (cmo5U34)-methyltransferase
VVAHRSFPPRPPARDTWLALRRVRGRLGLSGRPDGEDDRRDPRPAPVLSPEEDEALMREAGFGEVSLFYAALTFRGWVACA